MPAPRDVDAAPRRPLLPRVVRYASLGVVLASFAGLAFSGLQLSPAVAASDDSSLTVKWVGDTGAAASYQPPRDASSVHYNDFKDLSVTVSQTSDIGDQAIRVTVSGLAPTLEGIDDGGQLWSAAQNFVQAMECWGDPTLVDPTFTSTTAPDFRTTCQWGGRYAQNNGLGNTVYRDNVLRPAQGSMAPTAVGAVDVPFQTFGGTQITGRETATIDVNGNPDVAYPLLTYMNPATTNEVQGARISSGTTSFEFEAQSSSQAPQLGCGREGHLRCWLVLVPRGSHYGGQDATCSYIADNRGFAYTYGRANAIQGGSPLNPGCDYWNNRMVIPLNFTPTGVTCPAGAAERSLIGSQLLINAMASWQPALCKKVGVTFNFSANPDSVARLQLLDGGAGLAFGSFPIVKAELDDATGEAEFDRTTVAYAPVAIGASVVGYFAESFDGRITQLNLTPRLMAKLLTQSYPFQVPRSSAEPAKNIAHLGAVNRSYEYLRDDPDFRNANPDNWQEFSSNPSIVLPGPASADAIKQVWRWILADDQAAAWLAGGADEAGMTVNPYYLPKGNPAAKVPVWNESGDPVMEGTAQKLRDVGLSNPDGTPMKLSETVLDRFLKVDESQVPLKLTLPNQTRYDSLQAFPYVDTLATAARVAFRADPGAKIVWDPARVNAAGQIGDWVSAGGQIPGQRFMIAVTDLASADRYALDTASLRLADRTDYVAPTLGELTNSLSSLVPTAVTAVKQVDPSAVTAGYPLTTVVYATVNLSGTDATARRNFGSLIREITTTGQVPGTSVGDLPPGYLPLTDALAGQATAAAAAIESYVTPTPSPSNNSTGGQDSYEASGSDGTTTDGTAGPEITAIGESTTDRTPEPAAAPIARAGLAVTLGFGVLGALFGPLLFRGRGAL